MIGWLNLSDDQRRATLNQATILSGISPKALEKDWWVTLTLKALFQSDYAPHLIFKGGTSLSKCWKLIERLSEDIDIALDPAAFGMAYLQNPGSSALNKLKKNGCDFISNQLKVELQRQIVALGIPTSMVTIWASEVDPTIPDTDPQTLHLQYPSLFDANPYLSDEVKIEVGVRSLLFPHATTSIQSLLHEINPNQVYAEEVTSLKAVEPKKTFLEKAFLLHEEFAKPNATKIRAQRMSRHLYDLGKIMHTNHRQQALEDHALYEAIINHRQAYSRYSWLNYDSLRRPHISFIPPAEVLEQYRADYGQMQEQMIYGETHPFDTLITELGSLQDDFRNFP